MCCTAIWGGDEPRVIVDLGSHASHGAHLNMSDALLALDRFHAPGSLVIGVDVFEDFALDLRRRMLAVEPYASMRGVERRSLQYAVDCCEDGARKGFSSTVRTHVSCCADHWCEYGVHERTRKADHLCRITRMRLGLVPSEPWLPSSSYPLATTLKLGARNLTRRELPPYDVTTIRLKTLWRTELHSRRIDYLKVDIDASWRHLGGLETLLRKKAIGVLTIEVDGSWGAVIDGWGVTVLDQLTWLARSFGYVSYLKVPCEAKKGRGSLESGVWKWDWGRRKYRVADGTGGKHAAWLHVLATPDAPWAPSRYHARRPHGVQDALLVDWSDERLKSSLAARCRADCDAV